MRVRVNGRLGTVVAREDEGDRVKWRVTFDGETKVIPFVQPPARVEVVEERKPERGGRGAELPRTTPADAPPRMNYSEMLKRIEAGRTGPGAGRAGSERKPASPAPQSATAGAGRNRPPATGGRRGQGASPAGDGIPGFPLRVGELQVSYLRTETVERAPIGGETTTARATVFLAEHPQGWSVQVADYRYPGGAREIACCDVAGPHPAAFHRLVGRLRMSVMPGSDGDAWVELSQARANDDGWYTLNKATLPQLNHGAGLDVVKFFDSLNMLAFGTREDVIDDGGPRRNYLCVVFKSDSCAIPIAACLLTRVLPMYRTSG